METKTTAYALSNSWADERRRMGLMSECLDGSSRRRLDVTGVGPGWRCLEVGGGNGSVATWLAERVGPSGAVVATDVDTRFWTRWRAGISRCGATTWSGTPCR